MSDKTKTFVKKAKDIHGNKYSYNETEYVHSKLKVTITCPVHGPFEKVPTAHLYYKQGCPKCSNRHSPTVEEFVQKAKRIHGDKYDYSSVQYKNNHTKIDIICPIHGTFTTKPNNHINRKTGCPLCGNVNRGQHHRKSTEEFIVEANKIHNSKYDYSLVNYHTGRTKVIIKCPIHGPFQQSPSSHLHQRAGCPQCSCRNYEGGYGKQRFDNHPEIKDMPAILYLIEVTDCIENFIKIGITHRTIFERFHRGVVFPYKYSINIKKRGKLFELFELEQNIKNQFRKFKYTPNKKFGGYTECFTSNAIVPIREYLNEQTDQENGKGNRTSS